MKIPIEVSARHIHLCLRDMEKLFGKGYQLKKLSDLNQPGEFRAEEKVTIQKNDKKIKNIRVVGPLREKTQIELSLTDAFYLGMDVPITKSGNLKGTPGILVVGPKGALKLKEGVICAWRHLHLSLKDAKSLRLKDGQILKVLVKGRRGLIFDKVIARVGEGSKTSLHLDTDEGNACGIKVRGEGEIFPK